MNYLVAHNPPEPQMRKIIDFLKIINIYITKKKVIDKKRQKKVIKGVI